MSVAPSRRQPVRLACRAYPSGMTSEVDPTASELAQLAGCCTAATRSTSRSRRSFSHRWRPGTSANGSPRLCSTSSLSPPPPPPRSMAGSGSASCKAKRSTSSGTSRRSPAGHGRGRRTRLLPGHDGAGSPGGVLTRRREALANRQRVSLRRPPATGRPACPPCQDRHRLKRPPRAGGWPRRSTRTPPTPSSHRPRRR